MDLCRVALTGRLTKDPELRQTAGGTSVASLRLGYSTRKKDASGQWGDKSNYIDIVVWANQGERVAQYLTKGSRIAVDGRLEWREWDAQDGTKRQAYEVHADSVVFLDSKKDGDSGNQFVPAGQQTDFAGADDDIPF